jgi:uncharacterized lipoprotein
VRFRATALAAVCAALLCGCATIHRWTHRQPAPGCHEAPFNGNADARAPLKVPEGLSAPDTTGAIKIPAVNDPDAPRGKNDPCLDMPPNYGNEPTGAPPPRRPPR